MKRTILFCKGIFLLTMFGIWTMLIQKVDVRIMGESQTKVGFAGLNSRFHMLTGVHMTLYTITDWLGLVPILICMVFGGLGLAQLIGRKSLLKVDYDIILLGIYYVIVIFGYLFFEMVPVNYRPVLIQGIAEASYPSSTTLLVLSVMPTCLFQIQRRSKKTAVKKAASMAAVLFSVFMVTARLICGVHWLTDIVGAVLLSSGLFCLYQDMVIWFERKKTGGVRNGIW